MTNLSGEQFAEHLPPAPGTAPIPEGHTRYYHQTGAENIPSIREHGLLHSKAKGIEGPKGVWVSHKPFYGEGGRGTATVEMHLPKDEGHIASLQHDVTPDQILAIHEDWHDKARYVENEPSVKESVLAGNEEWMHEDPTYSKVIEHIKRRSR